MPIPSGLDFKRKGVGCLILDKRDKKAKFVGVILRKHFSPGYKLCPLARHGFIFNMPVPKVFKSIHNAEQWVQRHAELWNPKRTYTPLNFMIAHIISNKLVRSPLVGLRLQVVIMQVLLAIVLAFCLPDDSVVLKVGVYNKKISKIVCRQSVYFQGRFRGHEVKCHRGSYLHGISLFFALFSAERDAKINTILTQAKSVLRYI